jgi:hypothetical protein
MPTSQRFGAPARVRIPNTMATSTMAVPRSGCIRISAAGTAAISSAGTRSESDREVRSRPSARSASTSAIPTITPTLASSAGWIDRPPTISQECEPLTVLPTPGTKIRASPASEPR